MCLCEKCSEKAIKWKENTSPQVSEMKVLHLRRGRWPKGSAYA